MPAPLVTTATTLSMPLLQTFYLLDRFGVSDQFYHELAMVHPELPRSYHMKNLRSVLSGCVEVEPLSPLYYGAIRPFTDFLKAAVTFELLYILLDLIMII